MRNFLDAKLMAKTLRQSLEQRDISLSHSECLELVAQQFGVANWNILSASIQSATEGGLDLVMPEGWQVIGDTDTRLFRLGLHPDEAESVLVESRIPANAGVDLGQSRYGNLGQYVSADAFIGKHVRLSAELSTRDAESAGIWVHVCDQNGSFLRRSTLDFRHVQGPLKGTTPWCERTIVTDVPERASYLTFGIYLRNFGSVSMRKINLEGVDSSVPLTITRPYTNENPVNLALTA